MDVLELGLLEICPEKSGLITHRLSRVGNRLLRLIERSKASTTLFSYGDTDRNPYADATIKIGSDSVYFRNKYGGMRVKKIDVFLVDDQYFRATSHVVLQSRRKRHSTDLSAVCVLRSSPSDSSRRNAMKTEAGRL